MSQKERNRFKIAVDFDGTCVCEDFPRIGKDVPYAIETLNEIIKAGNILILWTVRSGDKLNDAIKWFNDRKIILTGINEDPYPNKFYLKEYGKTRKISADIFIDDRNILIPTFIMKYNNKEFRVVNWIKVKNELKELGVI